MPVIARNTIFMEEVFFPSILTLLILVIQDVIASVEFRAQYIAIHFIIFYENDY
jgi:hypothetical protein